jgi:hypothetical protein
VHELVVTGPERQRLFELFSRVYAGRSDVRVVLDRRRGGGEAQPSAVHEAAAREAPVAPGSDSAQPHAHEPGHERRRRAAVWIFPPAEDGQ